MQNGTLGAIEPDRRPGHALWCAGLDSIELDDANADPNHSGFCGVRARRLQRQSAGQPFVAAALPGLRRPLHGLQSLQSHQLRTKQHRDRRGPLRASSATKAEGAVHSAYSSCAPASSPLNWRTRMRILIILAFVALLFGCNANQAINPSGQANRCANDPSCNPYNPSSYAQNNVGIGR
jgi:hypothetical protein